MKIIVTQEDIDNGCRQDGKACPVARAISRVTEKPFHVIYDALEINGFRIYLPLAARQFIAWFDNNRHVEPLEFELEIFP